MLELTCEVMKMLSQEQRLEEIKEMLAKKHKLTTHEFELLVP